MVLKDDSFKIFVDQLREGKEKSLDDIFSPEFLDVQDPDLSFDKPVKLSGLAYTTDDDLIINWTLSTEATVRCSICNEKVFVPIEIKNAYHGEPLASIKTGIFNFKDLLRETIILEVPPFSECSQGNCPARKELANYLKEPSDEGQDEKNGYQPFADIDWKT